MKGSDQSPIFDSGSCFFRQSPCGNYRALSLVGRVVASFRLMAFVAVLSSVALSALLAGCSFLKPAKSTARYFVLTPVPTPAGLPAEPESVALGVGQVKIPAYLFNTSIAVRKGTNEIEYLPSAFWAERLDAGFQRVLAANLAVVLPSRRIRLSAWPQGEVGAEVYVTIEQFDVDAGGRGVLVARWRILAPGGAKVLRADSSRLSHQGPAPDADASGAVATLSELAADFSRQLAQAVRETAAVRDAPGVPRISRGE
jgi:uncharacterized lipoprotein YmbA